MQNDLKIGDKIEMIRDHVRSGKVLAKLGQTGTYVGVDLTMHPLGFNVGWITVRLDGYKSKRCLHIDDIKKIQ